MIQGPQTSGQRACCNAVSHPWLAMLFTLLIVIACAYGGQFLGFDNNYRVFFSKENQQLTAFDEIQAVYSKIDNTMIVIKPREGDVFQPRVVGAIQELTEAGWKLPYATRVDSLSNFQHTYAEGDDLTVIDLIEQDPETITKEELQQIKQVALNEPLIVKRVISPDGKTTGVNIIHTFPQKSIEEVPQTAQAVRKVLDDIRVKYPEIEFRPSGIVFMNNAFAESSKNDLMTLIPLMYGGLLLAMLFFLRSLSATFATLLVIAFSAMTAMGIAGWFGIKLTPPSSTAPTVILTLAIADSIHIIAVMLNQMSQGLSKRDAIRESIRINLQPVFLTSLTTVIGFLSLNFSDAPPFRDLGNITAVGVAAAFFYSIFFLPAALSVLPIKARASVAEGDLMQRIAEFVIRCRNWLLPSGLITVVILGLMIPKLELNDEFVKYFDHSIDFRGDTEFMIDNLTGIYTFEYSLEANGPSRISDPEYLANVEKFANWLRQQPEIIHVYSLTDIFKRLNKNMHGDDESWYRIPDTLEMASQYLLLYEFSLPYGLDLNDRMNIDKSALRLTATIDDLSTVEVRAFKERVETWMASNLPDYMQAEATSPNVMFAYISERNINSMSKGNILALLLISLSILIALRSVKMGAISLVPNLIPAIVTFGIWALLVGQVNMAVAIVSAVSLGIIVDDTIHFLSKYYRGRKEKGMDAPDAVRYAFSMVGSALFMTSVILIAGFSILAMSAFQINKSLGILTAITIAVALIADFLILPPLLMALDRAKQTKEKPAHA